MGVALGDFNSSIDSGQAGGGGQNDQNIIDQMKQNAQKWWDATLRGDKETADYYDKLNYQLGTSIGAHRDHNGVWWDKYGNKLFDTHLRLETPLAALLRAGPPLERLVLALVLELYGRR